MLCSFKLSGLECAGELSESCLEKAVFAQVSQASAKLRYQTMLNCWSTVFKNPLTNGTHVAQSLLGYFKQSGLESAGCFERCSVTATLKAV